MTVVAPALAAAGTVKVAPLNEPAADVGGAAGVVVTAVVPTLTDVMVLLAENPRPLRKTLCPAATDERRLPFNVAATVAPGLSVKGLVTMTELSESRSV